MTLPSYITDYLKQKGVDASMFTVIDDTTKVSYLRAKNLNDITYFNACRRSGGSVVHVIIDGDTIDDDTVELLLGITELVKERIDMRKRFEKIMIPNKREQDATSIPSTNTRQGT